MTHYKFCLMDVDARRLGGGGRLNVDICGQEGREGQKLAKSCGRLLWMAPKRINVSFTQKEPNHSSFIKLLVQFLDHVYKACFQERAL